MKLSRLKWLLLPFGAAGVTVAVLAALNPSMEAQTSPQNPNERLRTRHYLADIEELRRGTLEIIPYLRKYGAHWRIVNLQKGLVLGPYTPPQPLNKGVVGLEKTIVAEVPVLMFTDQLEVMLRAEKGYTRVDVHSKSRFPGRSDLGENRRHVLQLLAALDGKFKQVGND